MADTSSVAQSPQTTMQQALPHNAIAPSFERQLSEELHPRRVVFSRGIWSIGERTLRQIAAPSAAQRKGSVESLRLIANLTNRPLDSLYADYRLVRKPQSKWIVWSVRCIVFVLCIGVGFLGSLFVQQLNTDPRKQIRAKLAVELIDQHKRVRALSGETAQLRNEVDKRTIQLTHEAQNQVLFNNEMANGMLAVTGNGIAVSLADPLAAANAGGADDTARVAQRNRVRVVTDADVQIFESLLWRAGAEAISVNGYRIGVQTSVRTAGNLILVGVNQVQSPYVIQAIGDPRALLDAVSAYRNPRLYDALQQTGIYPHASYVAGIRMPAAALGDVTFAHRAKS